MNETLLLIVIGLSAACFLLLVLLVRRGSGRGQIRILTALESFSQCQEKTERLLAEEIRSGRREAFELSQQQRQELTESARQARQEMAASLKAFNDSVLRQMGQSATLMKNQLESFEKQLAETTLRNEEKLERMRRQTAADAEQARGELAKTLEAFRGQISKLVESSEKKSEELKGAVEKKLTALQEDNAKRLEAMRQTVDEKLQGTLEKRLGESFKQVSERLEQVHQGLGEMQTLAIGVGDLKKVMTNVKARGTWGEVQLARLLEDIMTPDQYERNVATRPGSHERVEFALKLPGRDQLSSEVVWLPIDAKFYREDYQRIVEASEQGDGAAVEAAGRQLELKIKASAGDIASKYLSPPDTTDFAIMFLPTEGLYSEVIRRPGLVERLQQEYRVVVSGPTTLAALLNSLQMGFRTLAIQKRSSEVWEVLGAVKTEFGKFGDVIGKVHKKLQEASSVVEQAQTRTRAMERKLRDVQQLPTADAQNLLGVAEEIEEQ